MQRLNRIQTRQLVALTHKTAKFWQQPRVLYQTRCLATLPVGEVLFPTKSDFPSRHIGPRKTDVVAMLDTLGFKSLEELTNKAVPSRIQLQRELNLEKPLSEYCQGSAERSKRSFASILFLFLFLYYLLHYLIRRPPAVFRKLIRLDVAVSVVVPQKQRLRVCERLSLIVFGCWALITTRFAICRFIYNFYF